MKEAHDRDLSKTNTHKVGDIVGLKPEGGDGKYLGFGDYLPCVVISVGKDKLHVVRYPVHCIECMAHFSLARFFL